MATTALVTAADLEQASEGARFELVRGEMREMSPLGGRHARIMGKLSRWLTAFVDDNKLGIVYLDGGFVITRDPDTVVAPDLAFVRTERVLPEDEQTGYLRQAPAIAIEIVSPNDRASEVLDKVMLYLGAGVALVWIVDPQRQRVMVWDANHHVQEYGLGQILEAGDVLPGFQLSIGDIFSTGPTDSSTGRA